MKQDVEHQKLNAIKQRFELAVQTNNIESMRSDTDEDFSFVSFTDRSFSNVDSFIEQWKKTRQEMIGSGSFETNLEPQPSLFFGDIAISHGNSHNHMVNAKGKAFDFTSNWTVVFKKNVDGEWKVVRVHNSIDPFGNPMLKDAVKNRLLTYAGIALVVGVAIGLVMGMGLA